MRYRVVLLEEAREDLRRLHDFLLERELDRDGGDLALPDQAVGTIESALRILEVHPYTCRKTGESPFWRELVISFASTGYLAVFEITGDGTVLVSAIRHQREDDYH